MKISSVNFAVLCALGVTIKSAATLKQPPPAAALCNARLP
jgi:hypothetical protein